MSDGGLLGGYTTVSATLEIKWKMRKDDPRVVRYTQILVAEMARKQVQGLAPVRFLGLVTHLCYDDEVCGSASDDGGAPILSSAQV